MSRFSNLPTIFHLTHPKAGSHWIYQVLTACAPERIITPIQPSAVHFTGQPILPGMIYPDLYLTRPEFEAVPTPASSLKFVVIRDPRDTLISAYFSFRYSHIPTYIPAVDYRRVQLNSRSLEEGLRHLLHTFLPVVARIQTSWLEAGVLVIRYEELLQAEFQQFERLFSYCQIELTPAQLRQIIKSCSFESRSGRPRGVEDVTSHYRKGVAGDWRNYLKGDLLAEFKEYYDDLVIEAGYETNRDWGLADLPRTYSLTNPVKQFIKKSVRAGAYSQQCWCSSKNLVSFSPDYDKCTACGSLVCKYKVGPADIIVSEDETDLYGRRYWLEPRFYSQRGKIYPPYYHQRGNIHERAQTDLTDPATLKQVQTLLKYKKPGARVLDVGCGSGALVALMRQAGFEAAGLELSPWVAELARQRFDIPVFVGPLETQTFEPGSFEAIVLLDVLQHLPDPLATLQHCLQLLAAEGLLLIKTPLFDASDSFEALCAANPLLLIHLRPIEHLYLFTTSSLQLLLARIGCRWLNFEAKPLIVAGRRLLSEIDEAVVTATLMSAGPGRLLQALFDQQANLEMASHRRREDRLNAFDQLRQALTTPERALQTDLIEIGQGWYPVETYRGDTFCWIANDAEFIIRSPTGRRKAICLELEPGPGLNRRPFELRVLNREGGIVTTARVRRRETITINLPVTPAASTLFRLHVEGGGLPTPNDPRTLNFRVFRFGWA